MNIHRTTLGSIGLALALPIMLAGQLKIGYIDSNRIMQEFEDVRAAQAKLEKETLRLKVEYDLYVERLDSLNKEFERQRLLLSTEKIREKQQQIQALFQQTQQYQQAKFGPEGDLVRYQAQLMAPVLDKVDIAVKKIGAERSYDYIVDAAGGALVYAVPAHDLTSVVIEELRRTASK